jgi:hypothetical protein
MRTGALVGLAATRPGQAPAVIIRGRTFPDVRGGRGEPPATGLSVHRPDHLATEPRRRRMTAVSSADKVLSVTR